MPEARLPLCLLERQAVQERARIEASALAEEAKHCQQHVPALYYYDPQLALIVMQYLAPPHEILRKSLVSGRIFPRLASHVGTFLAQTLFKTSLLALDTRQYRYAFDQVSDFGVLTLFFHA